MARFASSGCITLLLLASGEMFGQAAVRQCGYDRWPVKTLVDKDRNRVNFQPVDTTVERLGSIPIHEIPYPYDRRIAPEELIVFRVRATLLRVRHEKDSDLHLLLADPNNPEKRMIAEIPSPECAEGSGHESEYATARRVAQEIKPNATVELIGVGFFDFIHEQTGAAANGIELHPVLRIRSVAQGTVSREY